MSKIPLQSHGAQSQGGHNLGPRGNVQNYRCKPRTGIVRGDKSKESKLYRMMRNLCGEIKSRGPLAQRDLLVLLQDENVEVRLCAATYALEFDMEAAVSTLEKISHDERNLTGFTAQKNLEAWRAGRLRFPP